MKIINAVKRFFTVPVSSHRWMDSKSMYERLALITRAHNIYFKYKNLISYEDIVAGWFKSLGFTVDRVDSYITPYTAGCTVQVFWPLSQIDGIDLSVILFTKTA